jgi:DNA repair protein RadA/Sms
VQTCVTEEHSSAAGSVAQLRLVASQLMEMAKREGVATMLAGHVTKDGDLAGPRLLEHHACAGGPGWF